MNPHDTRSGDGYTLRGWEHSDHIPRLSHYEPEYYGGLSFWAGVALMCAGAAGTVWAVEMASRVWMF
jgi:hypothetical protein